MPFHRISRSAPARALARRTLLGAGAALAASQALAGFNFFTSKYTLSRGELQQLIARRFPLTRGAGDLFNVTLSDPQSSLDAAANRIAIAAKVAMGSALLPQPVNGQITLSSALRYDPPTRTLQLEHPTVEHIALDGITGQDAERLQRIGAVVAQELLQGWALHTFSAKELTVGFKTYQIGDITVHQDGISVQLK
jgi:hypothetical protein